MRINIELVTCSMHMLQGMSGRGVQDLHDLHSIHQRVPCRSSGQELLTVSARIPIKCTLQSGHFPKCSNELKGSLNKAICCSCKCTGDLGTQHSNGGDLWRGGSGGGGGGSRGTRCASSGTWMWLQWLRHCWKCFPGCQINLHMHCVACRASAIVSGLC